jgi:hypothetical protein
MINLIPNEEKKKKVKDFYFRLVITFFMVMGASILVAVVCIMPAFFLSQVKKNLSLLKFDEVTSQKPSSPEEILGLQKDLDKKLKLIEKSETNHYLVSENVINQILKHKTDSIKISSINYNNDTKGKTINISGVATSRDILLAFKKTVEEDPAFKKVDLPISNFVKGSNISFSMTITPA